MPQPNDKQIRIPKGFGAVEVRKETLDVEARTVEVCWTTGSRVRRYSWDEGYYMEELLVDAGAIRLERFAAMSLLDTHESYSMEKRLGTIVPGSVRIEKGKAFAVLKFSKKALAEEIFQDLKDGHPVSISVGYRIHKYEKTEASDGQLPVLRAIDWEPLELSAVPVPADAGAHSRSDPKTGEFETVSVRHDTPSSAAVAASNEGLPMNKRDAAKTLKGKELDALALGSGISRTANETDEALSIRLLAAYDAEDKARADAEARERAAAEEATRRAAEEAANRGNPGTTPGATPNAGLTQAQVDEQIRTALASNQARTDEIHALAASAGMDIQGEAVRNAVRGNVTAEAFRRTAFEHMVSRQAQTPTFPHVETRGMQDAQTTMRSMVAAALMHRHGYAQELPEGAREWRSLGSMDMMREILRMRGERTTGAAHDIVARGMHTTSDFPLILQDVTNRIVLSRYQAAENTFQHFATRRVLTDYRETKVLDVGGMPDLKLKNEHGEFESGTLRESEEGMRLRRFGRRIGFTHELLVNDYLNQFLEGVASWGEKVAKLEGDIVWGAIIENTMKLKDGKVLWHADHKNLAASGTALDMANVTAARLAMRTQKDIDGEPIALNPKYLFTGSALEIAAQQLVTAPFNPVVLGEAIPPQIRSLVPVYEYRLDKIATKAWFLFADAASTGGRGIHYLHLLGHETPATNEKIGFSIEGIEFTIAHSFGVGLTGAQWGYKNPGLN